MGCVDHRKLSYQPIPVDMVNYTVNDLIVVCFIFSYIKNLVLDQKLKYNDRVTYFITTFFSAKCFFTS